MEEFLLSHQGFGLKSSGDEPIALILSTANGLIISKSDIRLRNSAGSLDIEGFPSFSHA